MVFHTLREFANASAAPLRKKASETPAMRAFPTPKEPWLPGSQKQALPGVAGRGFPWLENPPAGAARDFSEAKPRGCSTSPRHGRVGRIRDDKATLASPSDRSAFPDQMPIGPPEAP